MAAADAPEVATSWQEPGRPVGVVGLWRRRALLHEMARVQHAQRFRGTKLGVVWAYISPLVQFTVYFFVIGVLLGLNRRVEEFGIYIFSALVVVQLFNGGLTRTTSAFTSNRSLMRKVWLPREYLPLSRVWNDIVWLGPPLLVLLVVVVLRGWRPDVPALLVAAATLTLVGVFTAGLGLAFAVIHVFIRDMKQVVDVITTLTRWATPVIYPWTAVQDQFGDSWITTLYLSNPVTIGAFGMREAFWHPVVGVGLPPIPMVSVWIGIAVTAATVALGFVLLRRYEQRMVQRLRWTS
jgi:ABC-2 type transport system permease protein